jgi:hypothetical protein
MEKNKFKRCQTFEALLMIILRQKVSVCPANSCAPAGGLATPKQVAVLPSHSQFRRLLEK